MLEVDRVNFFISKQNIIVKLATLDTRENVIKNVKSMKSTTDMICNKWPTEKVFINACLTKSKRSLFSQTRAPAKEKQYKSA